MTWVRLDNRTAGIALLVGYSLLLAVLYRNPADGLSTATATVQGFLFFVLLPVSGLVSGVYVILDLPFRTAVGFPSGSYLAVVGIGIAFLSTAATIATTALGIGLGGIGVLAIVASLQSAVVRSMPADTFQ